MKKLLILLAAVFCLAACEDKMGFMYDKVYDDPDIFNLPVKMDAPSQVTESGATFKIMIKTKDQIVERGVLIAEEPLSNHPQVFYSDETGNIFEITVSGLWPGTAYYARPFILTASGEVIAGLEQAFVTLGTK